MYERKRGRERDESEGTREKGTRERKIETKERQ